MLWVGWYGFNPGSQLTYSGAANAEATTWIAVTTTLSAAVGSTAAMILSWVLFGKPDLSMCLNGALAGLVGITANCDQVGLGSAAIIGAVSGVLVVSGILLLDKLKIDDPVGAFPVHGMCGIWGGLATGIFGTSLPEQAGSQLAYFLIQLKATAIICVWAFGTMFILFQFLKAINMLGEFLRKKKSKVWTRANTGCRAFIHPVSSQVPPEAWQWLPCQCPLYVTSSVFACSRSQGCVARAEAPAVSLRKRPRERWGRATFPPFFCARGKNSELFRFAHRSTQKP
ncbi:MAG: hypothetical protein R3C49_02945 [Planctomycetaceae bacterium]